MGDIHSITFRLRVNFKFLSFCDDHDFKQIKI
jgi:hypothetical protein